MRSAVSGAVAVPVAKRAPSLFEAQEMQGALSVNANYISLLALGISARASS
jgi:hypothetical protein